jgi:hypothetical protein
VDKETKQPIEAAVEKTVEIAEETVRRPDVKRLAQLGFYTKGFLFVLTGTLAIMVVGAGGRPSDATGALAAIALEPYGKVLLGIFVFGAIGHGLWNILRGLADVDNAGGGWRGIIQRATAVGIGIFYLGLALSALEIILAARVRNENSQAEETFVGLLLAVPVVGVVMSILIGLGVMIAGVHECYSGLTGKYQKNYRLWEISWPHYFIIVVLGVLSFTARAVLLVVMGYLFAKAAFGPHADSIGLDAALMTIISSGYGRWLVLYTGIGLICHGVLALFEAKYRRIC